MKAALRLLCCLLYSTSWGYTLISPTREINTHTRTTPASIIPQPLSAEASNDYSYLKIASEAHRTGQFVASDIEVQDATFQRVLHPDLPKYGVRFKRTHPRLCDPQVVQYSGYLDTSRDHHLFFWFFESRSNPSTDPLVLWLNGGPGCSSFTGLLLELGPCNISPGGKSTTANEFSWNLASNIIFLDQPVGVGFSYASDNSTITSSPAAAEDVWAFLQLFLKAFPEYSTVPFHVASESYGGTYVPHIASLVFLKNQDIRDSESYGPSRLQIINLASMMIGNGHTEAYTQLGSVPKYVCEGPYALFNDTNHPQCLKLRGSAHACQRLVQNCYNHITPDSCIDAGRYCISELYGTWFEALGLNGYDLRKKCNKTQESPMCYDQLSWIEQYLNQDHIKSILGAEREIIYKSCNKEVSDSFWSRGDAMHNTARLLPKLIEGGIRILIYAGIADLQCNYIGNERWMLDLPSPLQLEFRNALSRSWKLGSFTQDRVAGLVRTAGARQGELGNFTFVAVYEAGHMVPFDQPGAALDLFTRWIHNVALLS